MMNPIKQRDWRWGLALLVPMVVVCGGLYLARAGDGVGPVVQLQQGAPQLAVDNTEHEFPQAEPGTTVEHEFLIRNSGSRRLVLNLDECGCGRPIAESVIVMPGEQVTIPVSMKIKPFPQRQQKVAAFITSDPQFPQVEFTLTAELDWGTESSIQSPSDQSNAGGAQESLAQTVQN